MNDEFIIVSEISKGSEGHSITECYLQFSTHQMAIDHMSFDEIKRLSAFLNDYLKNKKGGAE